MSADKRDRVARVARKLFVEKGYHCVSIPVIVKASGLSTGAIYHYFSNKESLARYIYEQTLSDFQTMFFQRVAGAETTFEKLRAFAQLVFEITETDPEMMEYMIFMRHGEFLPDALPLCFSDPFRWIQQIVSAGIEQGELHPGNYLLSAISFTGVILRAVELRLAGVVTTPLSEISDELIGNAWAAIKA